MTHPPATCELCGDTGLYSPSALPCPKGCSAEDIVDRLNDICSTDDHERGCQGREYSCSCGFDDRTFATAKSAAEYITNMRQYISELEQRENDAYQRAYETRLKRHKSGCACHLDDDDNILSMCELHKDVEKDARAKALEDAAQVAEGNYDHIGVKTQHDRCPHDKFLWEDCDQCAAAGIRALKDEVR